MRDEMAYEPPPFTFDIETARGDLTSVAGKAISGGISMNGDVFSLTLDGGEGRSKVTIWLPREKANQLAKRILLRLAEYPPAPESRAT